MGKKQTFIVEIQDTQYDSWQGSIEWVQGQKKQAFRSTMEHLENITFLPGLEHEKFSMRMTEEEKAQRRIFYAEQFRKATQTAVQDGYDVLFLDEIVYTIRAGLFDEAMLIDFLKNKPEHLEVILTGRDPSPGLIELADYVSEIRKVKHPFDRGLPARRGIEC